MVMRRVHRGDKGGDGEGTMARGILISFEMILLLVFGKILMTVMLVILSIIKTQSVNIL